VIDAQPYSQEVLMELGRGEVEVGPDCCAAKSHDASQTPAPTLEGQARRRNAHRQRTQHMQLMMALTESRFAI
jgi:hypothetical protein